MSEREQLPSFVVTQNFYNPAFRDVEMELLPAAVDAGMGMLIWSPLAGGLTSGKYRRDRKPENGRHLSEWDEPPVDDEERLWNTVDALVEVGEELDRSPAQVSLAWLMARPGVTSVIAGARKKDQLADNLGDGAATERRPDPAHRAGVAPGQSALSHLAPAQDRGAAALRCREASDATGR